MTAPEAPATQPPPAGWYPDPEDMGMKRYWDGSKWTRGRMPVPTQPIPWWLPFVGYASALFLPIVGLILGIVLLTKKATRHGVAVVVISIGVIALGFAIAPSEGGESRPSLERLLEEGASKPESTGLSE